MRSFLRSWVGPTVLALCGCGLAFGQDDAKDLHPYKNIDGAPPAQIAPPDAGDKTERSTSALPYAAAVLSAVIVLSLICVPSRKAESATSR